MEVRPKSRRRPLTALERRWRVAWYTLKALQRAQGAFVVSIFEPPPPLPEGWDGYALPCIYPGCGRLVRYSGFCAGHIRQIERGGPLRPLLQYRGKGCRGGKVRCPQRAT